MDSYHAMLHFNTANYQFKLVIPTEDKRWHSCLNTSDEYEDFLSKLMSEICMPGNNVNNMIFQACRYYNLNEKERIILLTYAIDYVTDMLSDSMKP